MHVAAFACCFLVGEPVCVYSSYAAGGTVCPRFVAVAAKAEAVVHEGSPIRVEVAATQRLVAVGVGTPIANVRPIRVVMPLVAKVPDLQAASGVAVGAACTAALLGPRARIFTVWGQSVRPWAVAAGGIVGRVGGLLPLRQWHVRVDEWIP